MTIRMRPVSTRRFGKFPRKLYRFAGSFPTKQEAIEEANRHRARGKLARITRREAVRQYEVWIR